MRPPVIILGMHRSGTAILVELLKRLGFHRGSHVERNSEATFFLRRNDWMLRRAGGAWDHPVPAKAMLADEGIRSGLIQLMKNSVASVSFLDYTGLRGRAVCDGAWGWKDPRNIFTLAVWAGVFPGSRVLYLQRNGVDVAASLRARARDLFEGRTGVMGRSSLPRRLLEAFRHFEFHGHFTSTFRCLSIDESFALWEEYVTEAEAALTAFQGESLSLRFEELVANPESTLRRIVSFCGLDPTDNEISDCSAQLKADRVNAYRADPELVRFHDRVKGNELMVRLGYADRSRE